MNKVMIIAPKTDEHTCPNEDCVGCKKMRNLLEALELMAESQTSENTWTIASVVTA